MCILTSLSLYKEKKGEEAEKSLTEINVLVAFDISRDLSAGLLN